MIEILGVIALAAIVLIAWSAPGVIRRRRIDRAVRNYRIQVAQLGVLFARIGTAATEAGDILREFASAWDPLVVDLAHMEPATRGEEPK